MDNNKAYILGVDDESLNRYIMEDSLGDDYEVNCVDSGKSCLKAVQERAPDLILLDVSMPDMTGLEACRQLRQHPKHQDIPIIFVSALVSAEDRLAGYEAGGNDYISKPFDFNELSKKINLALDNSHEKKSLKHDSQEAMSTAMTAMMGASELGVILRFLQDSFMCADFKKLSEKVFECLAAYNLHGTLMFLENNQQHFYFVRGEEKPLEKSVLQQFHSSERIYTFGNRAIFNTPRVGLLIRTMPEDEGKSGRLRDHLAVLIDGVDSRIKAILAEQVVAKKQMALADVIEKTKNQLNVIDEKHRQQRFNNAQLLSKMGEEIEKSFIYLGLDEKQENEMLGIIAKTERDSDQLFKQGIEIDKVFDDIVAGLVKVLDDE